MSALKYAEACLSQGMGYQAAAMAAGINVVDLQRWVPGYSVPTRKPPKASCLPQIAELLGDASPQDTARSAALAIGLLIDRMGWAEAKLVALNAIKAGRPAATTPRENLLRVIDDVADQYELRREDLLGQCREKAVAHARQEAYWVLKMRFGMSYPAIGRLMGGRDHTTIIHGVRKFEARMAQAVSE